MLVCIACPLAASAAPDDKPPLTSNRGLDPSIKDAVKKAQPADYGFCSGPQNPHITPYAPVKIVLHDCNDMSQTYVSPPGPTNSKVGCGGGYAIAFGPQDKLSPGLTDITMIAEWADAPLQNSLDCGYAKLAAIAWGARCLDAACDKADWEMIEGAPKQRQGKWENNACTLQLKFTSQGVRYKTLSLDMIATASSGNQAPRKSAKGTIVAEKKDSTPCFKAETKPAPSATKK
jgi:hypothetical protein